MSPGPLLGTWPVVLIAQPPTRGLPFVWLLSAFWGACVAAISQRPQVSCLLLKPLLMRQHSRHAHISSLACSCPECALVWPPSVG